jgi:hypothetical protein
MKRVATPIIVFFGSMIFMLALGFFTGVGYKLHAMTPYMNTLEDRDVSNFIADTSYNYLDGHLIDLPNEIAEVSWYDDKYIDLMYCFMDDGGDIHLQFTGKKVLRDSLHLDDEMNGETQMKRLQSVPRYSDENAISRNISYQQ